MGLFDFFKKKATEEQPQTEEQQEGVLELKWKRTRRMRILFWMWRMVRI